MHLLYLFSLQLSLQLHLWEVMFDNVHARQESTEFATKILQLGHQIDCWIKARVRLLILKILLYIQSEARF